MRCRRKPSHHAAVACLKCPKPTAAGNLFLNVNIFPSLIMSRAQNACSFSLIPIAKSYPKKKLSGFNERASFEI